MELSLNSAMRSSALPAARDRAYCEPRTRAFINGLETSDVHFPACAVRSSQGYASCSGSVCVSRPKLRASCSLMVLPARRISTLRRASDSSCSFALERRGSSHQDSCHFSLTRATREHSRASDSRAPSLVSPSSRLPRNGPLAIRAAQTTNPPAKTPPSFNNPSNGSGRASGGSPSWTFPPSAPSRYPPAPLSAVPNPSRRQPAVIPLDAEALETLIPRTGSGPQVLQQLGSPPDWLRRFVVSMTGAVLLYNVDVLATVVAAFYWAWSPIWSVALRNTWLRASYQYAGLWKARVVDVEVVGSGLGATWHLVIGDHSRTTIELDVPIPLRPAKVRPGDPADLLVVSDASDLSRFRAVREVFLPSRVLWLAAEGEACVERGAFEELRKRVVLPAWLEDPEATEDEDLDCLYSLLSDENEQVINTYRPDDDVSPNAQGTGSTFQSQGSQTNGNAVLQDYQMNNNGAWSSSHAALAEDANILEFSSLGSALGSSGVDADMDCGSGINTLGDCLGAGFASVERDMVEDLDVGEG